MEKYEKPFMEIVEIEDELITYCPDCADDSFGCTVDESAS